jgi:crotonobetainyl-CoA:carnitine CoA-transferase CaiB-like acyl-CoA transferase
MTGPLDGVTVLDMTRALAGPYATMLLGGMGARVIKIEHPDGGDETRR